MSHRRRIHAMSYNSMIFPRLAAVVFVIFLVGSLSYLCIGGINLNVPFYAHANQLEHVNGKIVAIESTRDFVLETSTGQHLYFHCSNTCRASLKHLQRHMHEQATTDVYY